MSSLATRGWHRKPPPGVLPRLDPSHPLARSGLFWYCNEGGGPYVRDTTNQWNMAAHGTAVMPTWQRGGWFCNGDGTSTATGTTGAASTSGDVPAAQANITTGFSVWAWFKTGSSAPTGRQVIFGKSTAQAPASYEWELEASENVLNSGAGNFPTFVAFNSTGGGVNCSPYNATQLLANTEYQLLGVYGVTSANLYVNGRPCSNTAVVNANAIGTLGAPVNIGGRVNSSDLFINTFNGTVYAAAFWPYPLSAGAARMLYQQPAVLLQAKTPGQLPTAPAAAPAAHLFSLLGVGG